MRPCPCKDKWAEISPEDQAIIRDISQNRLFDIFGGYDGLNDRAFDAIKQVGVEIIDTSDAFTRQVQELAVAEDEAWIARADRMGVDGRAALDFYRAKAADYAGISD